MSKGYVGGNKLALGSVASPTAFTDLCEVVNVSGIGQRNDQVEKTTFCSVAKEFAAGLPEGEEVTLECNFVPGDADLAGLRAAVKARQERDFRLVCTDGTDTKTFYFRATCIAWTIVPSANEVNKVNFVVKITGDILEV